MDKYCLIGEKLGHSYSKSIHKILENEYDLVELKRGKLASFFKNNEYDGINVTIPYKETVIEYIQHLDEISKETNVVNAVVKRNGEYYGYNTDYYGLKFLIETNKFEIKGKVVLVLGSGATSRTVNKLMKDLEAKDVIIISRNGILNYQNCYNFSEVNIVINTSPYGMSPDYKEESCIDLSKFNEIETVIDVIYNPFNTAILLQAKKLKLNYANGLLMLCAGAKYADDIFKGREHENDVDAIKMLYRKIRKEKQNIVMIGMPGCGKSFAGRGISSALGLQFYDTDKLIEESMNMSSGDIISRYGEDYFRNIETEAILSLENTLGAVVAVGGGAVLNPLNRYLLQSNSIVIYIDRPINTLATFGRPLSQDRNQLNRLFIERNGLYEEMADIKIKNDNAVILGILKYLQAYELSV